jgi:hypothetical protein
LSYLPVSVFCLLSTINYPILSYAGYDRQDKLEESEASANSLSLEEWHRINDKVTSAGREYGFDKVLRECEVDVILAPADSFVPDVSSFSCKSTKKIRAGLQAHL